ncbi:GNAT family N-acetyltransferase [Sphingomonas nostoxanthinifaciens]|uniref:N-acetyltransferase n=1 Tax=Sphingomonas nostoxanthinifaciens TaxID=2872652 RepID=UPI001CC20846|nr:N-acetyltransferase [Sphingomonas nostoxanthinifaciens]UAK24300.1 N-acetyltransferase [Sphingomonas nostoxanthinifaciens]
MAAGITIRPVDSKADRKAFVELPFRHYAEDPAWIPPLKDEAMGLITPGKNPFFEHAVAQLFLAERGGKVVGRISASIDHMWTPMPADQGGGTDSGNWGYLDADTPEVASALIASAENWLRGKGVKRALGPVSMSIWEEPGLLIKGHAQAPTVMMGHDDPRYEAWIEAAGYAKVKDLHTWELDITTPFPPLIQRIVAAGEKNPRIHVREVNKKKFNEEAAIILAILNDAWSDNWGFVPFTESEIAFAGKKMKPIIFNDLVRIAEYDGEPVAFMMSWPDLNELQADLDGELFPFGFVKLLWRLNGGFSGRPTVNTIRVPLMGVVKRLQASRMASQLAFVMIEYIRRAAVANYGAKRSEIGWILEDNQGMNSIAETINSEINKTYRIYEKAL